jgi:WD40 repeat protein
VHSVDLKAMTKAGGPVTSGKPQAWQTTFALIDADCATAIKAVGYRNAACCVAVKAANLYSLRLYTASGASDRAIEDAHADYVTCLATSADNDSLLFSGARDGAVKCWDLRGSQPRATSLKSGHVATVSSISVARDVVLTTGLDGRACLWDLRKLGQPIACVRFDSPALSCATNAAKGLGVVATTRQLCVLSLHPFAVRDSVAGAYASATFGGTSGDAVFAVPMPPSISKGVVHGFRLADFTTAASV